jgi:AraC-like DNA-binding protein
MPSSAVHTFADPDEYAAAIRGTTVELTITERGFFTGKIIRIDLHRLWMQRVSDNLQRVAHAVCAPERAIITFRNEPGSSQLADGAEIHPNAIMRHSQGHDYHQRSSGSASLAGMSLPIEEMASGGAAAFAGCDLMPPRNLLFVTPPPSAMAKLQRLHAAAGELAEQAPEIIANPDAARGLEQALVDAMVACLSNGEVRQDQSAQRRHSLIMRRFHRAVEESADQPLYLPELCTEIGVSDRTLRVCCQEQLGMSPKRYLLLRRMHLARRALRDSAPGTTTVTEIATQYGFWQFGRFAGEYKALFGEAPSATLHCPKE